MLSTKSQFLLRHVSAAVDDCVRWTLRLKDDNKYLKNKYFIEINLQDDDTNYEKIFVDRARLLKGRRLS